MFKDIGTEEVDIVMKDDVHSRAWFVKQLSRKRWNLSDGQNLTIPHFEGGMLHWRETLALIGAAKTENEKHTWVLSFMIGIPCRFSPSYGKRTRKSRMTKDKT
jgi:hypothetical protein